MKYRLFINIITIAGFIFTILFIIYGIQQQLFTSETALNTFLLKFGILAPIIFILFQIVQVIIPILPGSIGSVGGIVFFGPLLGSIYNYIGICIGSLAAFYLARKHGEKFVKYIAKPKQYKKYKHWLSKDTKFDKWFAIAIFSPIAPDDLLCYLAGITKITYKKFIVIILLGKPFSILIYSFGLKFLIQNLITFLR